MTGESNGSLRQLQQVDLQLAELKRKIAAFDPLMSEVDRPAVELEGEVETLRGRLREMKVDERRLEHSADDRRSRSRKLQDRLKSVRNLREEAAVRAEMDLLRMALEGDEQEALTLLDQIRKMEDRLQELERALEEARAAVEPRKQQLRSEQEAALEEQAVLEERRKAVAATVPAKDLRNYERIRGGGRTVAVANLTPDGACGNCFGMIPIQLQNEIRKGAVSITCEACGVLLSAGEDGS
jgi:predicted  nucleic acid-binding Zn-ribbon protein